MTSNRPVEDWGKLLPTGVERGVRAGEFESGQQAERRHDRALDASSTHRESVGVPV